MSVLPKIHKTMVDSIGLINLGILAIIFIIFQLFLNTYLALNSLSAWAIIALVFTLPSLALIWGFRNFRTYKGHFKTDGKTKRLLRLELISNSSALTILGTGFFLTLFSETRSFITHEGHASTYIIHPYQLQGLGVLIVGATIFFLTYYLYKRFIPEQVIEDQSSK